MADKVVSLEFNVKTAGAVTEINKVTKATEGATAASNEYEKQLNDIKKATEGAGFKDLSRALKEYQDIALKAGETTPIGRQALAEAGELKDRLLDLKGAIKTTGQDGLALQGSLQLGGGIVAGFGAVQGVMALVGSESEDLQKTLVKLQAVQATLASVEEIRSVLEKESALRIMAVTVAEKARAAATVVSTFVTNGSTLALKAFRVALIGTGIGAIVVLLIAAADAMGLFGDSADAATISAEGLNKELEKQSDLTKRLNTQIDRNLEKQILKAKIAGQSEEQISKLQIDAQNLRTKNLEDFALKTLRIEALIVKNTKSTEEEKIEAKKKTVDAYKAVDDAIQKQSVLNLQDQLIIADKAREIEKAAEEKRKADLKTAADARRAKEKEWQAELQADKDKLAADEKIKADKKLADDQQAALVRADLLAADLAGEKASADSKKAYDQEVYDTKIKLAMQGFDLINQLASLSGDKSKAAAKRAFEINKAFQLAQATMEGYRAVLSTYAQTPGGVVLKSIAAGLAGAFAGVQIAKISQSKFDSAKFDNTKAPADVPLTAAAPRQTTAPQTPGRVSNITGSQTTTVKAIVVESDITTTQKRINSIQEIAKI